MSSGGRAATAILDAARFMNLHRELFLPYLLACSWIACAPQALQPITNIDTCLAPKISGLVEPGEQISVQCSLTRSMLVIAVPSRRPIEKELVDVGVPQDAARAVLRGTRAPGNSWCTVEQVKSKSEKNEPGWDVVCVQTEVQIDRLSAIHADSIIFVLNASDGRARLLQLRKG